MGLFKKREKTEAGLKKTRDTFFGRIGRAFARTTVDDSVWDELEEALIASDAGAVLASRLLETVRERCKREHATDGTSVRGILVDEMLRILNVGASQSPMANEPPTLPSKPYVVLMVGVNGVGKTTSIAKLAYLLATQEKQVVLAAGDTFRAAGIEQLEIWGQRAKASVIAHKHGADPGAVAFDALQAAQARGADVVIIDTAGRLHTKVNLMEELKKIHRVVQRFDAKSPHETLLVLDATTGQNGVAQAKSFAEAVGVTGLFLAKLDGTAKGGVALAIADQLKLPIVFIGTGEQIDDIAPFDARAYVEALLAAEA
ncbi:MAG: signal recognition particle-docking protein FtsY [Chloroflexi bacterium]|nr:signal recognition particle-docking protein FtsY [Chloroflexota bacterium]